MEGDISGQVEGSLSGGGESSGDGDVLRDEHEGMETEVTEPGEMVSPSEAGGPEERWVDRGAVSST